MKVTRKSWNEYISRLSKLNEEAGKKMTQYVEQYGIDDSEKLIAYANSLIVKYCEGSSELACQMYDAMAAAEKANVPPAEPAELPEYREVAKMVNATKKSTKELARGTGRLVKRASADTTLKNAIRDGAEFAWIPNGDTCAFCVTLASRGWQRISKKALKNGHAEHIHANCDCQYAIRFNKKTNVEGFDPDEYLEKYNAAGGDINKMRRVNYVANREHINVQKRAAYLAKKQSEMAQKTAESRLQNAVGKIIIEVQKTTLYGAPASITQVATQTGGITRNYYDSTGKWIKQISNNDHGNAKCHPYGKHGEHAHDIVWKDGAVVDRPVRELTEEERKENGDIL